MSSRRNRTAELGVEPVPIDGTTLLLAPSIGPAERETCLDLLCRHSLGSTDVIHVLYMESPSERFASLDDRVHEHPARTAILAVGAGGAVGDRGPDPPHDDYHVDSLADPADLTGLGMRLTNCLRTWYGDARDVTLCFDSLSILLQYTDVERVFRFLHTISVRLEDAGASGHFHLDPAAHDEQTVARLSQLFDTVVEVSADGERTVHE
jgi:hypothetical protein